MDQEPLFTFLPDTADLLNTLVWSAAFAILGLLGCLALLWRSGSGRQRNYRLLGAMLLFFVFLIAGSSAFFSGLTRARTGPVYLFADAIETPRGKVAFGEIRNARILTAGNRSLLDPQQIRGGQRLLLLELEDGSTHVLAEAHYPVNEILGRLRDAVRAWEEKE